jgi:hypothetical protein
MAWLSWFRLKSGRIIKETNKKSIIALKIGKLALFKDNKNKHNA